METVILTVYDPTDPALPETVCPCTVSQSAPVTDTVHPSADVSTEKDTFEPLATADGASHEVIWMTFLLQTA